MRADTYLKLKSHHESLLGFREKHPTHHEFRELAHRILECCGAISSPPSPYFRYIVENVVEPAEGGFSTRTLQQAIEAVHHYTEQFYPWKRSEKRVREAYGHTANREEEATRIVPESYSHASSAKKRANRRSNKRNLRRYCSYDVFLTYASPEQEVADTYRTEFERRDIRCFVASHNVAAGADWSDELRNALYTSGIFVALMTPESYRRTWVLTEVGAAWVLGLDMIPVIADLNFDQLAGPLNRHHGYRMDRPNDFERLIQHVSELAREARENGGYPVPNRNLKNNLRWSESG